MRLARSPTFLLQPVDHNPGILPVKEGQALISSDKWTIVKILDLNLIREDLKFNLNRYANLNTHMNHYFDSKPLISEINDIKTQTDFVKKYYNRKIKSIITITKT